MPRRLQPQVYKRVVTSRGDASAEKVVGSLICARSGHCFHQNIAGISEELLWHYFDVDSYYSCDVLVSLWFSVVGLSWAQTTGIATGLIQGIEPCSLASPNMTIFEDIP